MNFICNKSCSFPRRKQILYIENVLVKVVELVLSSLMQHFYPNFPQSDSNNNNNNNNNSINVLEQLLLLIINYLLS